MLLRFSVSNWMSYRDEATLDLIATREEQHNHHLAALSKYKLKVLPVAAIYGGNASGKSNLAKALRFAKNCVPNSPKPDAPTGVKTFLLGGDTENPPTSFRFEIFAEDTIYEYSFALSNIRIVEEKLVRVNARKDETLFHRVADAENPRLSDKIADKNAQSFAFRGTQENQLFLNNSVSQRLEEFKPIFDWFRDDLILIDPQSFYAGLLDYARQSHPRFGKMSARLRELDSGIQSLEEAEVSATEILPKHIIDALSADLTDGGQLQLAEIGEEGAFLRLKDGKPTISRLIPMHLNTSGKLVPFQFVDESDGTRRLLHVLPAFLMLADSNFTSTFIIDELDRSLHPNLTRNLVETFLARRQESSRSQLIFTSHDAQLMTQDIFRRDEIWLTERDGAGASKLVPLSEFKDVRSDKDIRKSYLQGRMGGVPRIQNADTPCEEVMEAQ